MTFIATPARLSSASSTFDAEFKARLHWSAEADAAIEQRVADILADVQAAAVGEYHVCALLTSKDIRCWGENYTGQLGDASSGWSNGHRS